MTTMVQTERRTLIDNCLDLMRDHGLIDKGWAIKLNNNKSTAGICNHSEKVIYLSRFYLNHNTEEATMNTITHEIAHALVGPGNGHNRVWRAKHIELGGNGSRTFSISGDLKKEYAKAAKWTGTCVGGHAISRNRLTQVARNSSCSQCSPTYNADYRFKWTQNY